MRRALSTSLPSLAPSWTWSLIGTPAPTAASVPTLTFCEQMRNIMSTVLPCFYIPRIRPPLSVPYHPRLFQPLHAHVQVRRPSPLSIPKALIVTSGDTQYPHHWLEEAQIGQERREQDIELVLQKSSCSHCFTKSLSLEVRRNGGTDIPLKAGIRQREVAALRPCVVRSPERSQCS